MKIFDNLIINKNFYYKSNYDSLILDFNKINKVKGNNLTFKKINSKHFEFYPTISIGIGQGPSFGAIQKLKLIVKVQTLKNGLKLKAKTDVRFENIILAFFTVLISLFVGFIQYSILSSMLILIVGCLLNLFFSFIIKAQEKNILNSLVRYLKLRELK